MQRLVFFGCSVHSLSHSSKIILDLAVGLSLEMSNEVYYVNISKESELSKYPNHNVCYIDLDDFNALDFDDALFITRVQDYIELLITLRNNSNARVCFYCTDESDIKPVIDVLGGYDGLYSIKRLLRSNHSLICMNNYCLPCGIDRKKTIIVPNFLFDIGKYYSKPICKSDEINIAYYGEYGVDARNALIGLINDLGELNLKLDVNIHIIGDLESLDLKLDFKKITSGYSRIFVTGNLTEEKDLYEYLSQNVDLILCAPINSVNISKYGVPVISCLPDMGVDGRNQYVRLYDSGESPSFIFLKSAESIGMKTIDLKEIIFDIYQNNQKLIYADRCRDYIQKNALFNTIKNRICEYFLKVSLSIKICKQELCCSRVISQFNTFSQEYGGENVVAFLEYVATGTIPKKEILYSTTTTSEDYNKFMVVQKRYNSVVKRIRKRKGKLKVAFLVMFKESFPSRGVFEKMLTSKSFDPYIIVVPNIWGPMKAQMELYNLTYDSLHSEYADRVLHGFNSETDTYLELHSEYSLLFFCNPYAHYDHEYHNVRYFLDKDVLPIYLNYGFPVLKFWEEVVSFDFHNYMWKVCIETQFNMEYLKEIEGVKGYNGILTGYAKMDDISKEKRTDERKTIILSPHHTVYGWSKLNISNFLRYSELFLKLPEMFPEVQFVFRPHPLLFPNLKNKKIWSNEKIDNYLARIEAMPNMVYDESDYYLDKFVNSDAIIHDCGSFIAEYLYTKKPCCYMMKSRKATMDSLLPIGQECLDNYYTAENEQEIIDFIRNVVIKGIDPKKDEREKFVESKIMINYPHVSEYIVNYLEKELR